MKTRSLAIATVLAASVVAQSTSAISGKVISADDGLPLSDAPIQAKNTSTGAISQVRSKQDGTYILRGLPAGTYQVSASYPGLLPFNRPDVALRAAESVRLDIRIEYPYLAPLGESREDDAARRRLVHPDGPMPRLPGGKPDLSGLWLNLDQIDAGNPEPLPWAAARRKQQLENHSLDWPELHCLPLGPILQGEDGDNTIIQGPKTIAIFYDIGHDLPRLVYPAWFTCGWPAASERSESLLDGPLRRALGGRHAGDRYRGLQRPRVGYFFRLTHHRTPACNRTLPANRFGTPGKRNHH